MQLTGVGLYTISEAARLAGVRSVELRRWLRGYISGRGEDVRRHPPLWTSEIAEAAIDAVSFHDLLEVRFVKAFRNLGISLQAIRIAATNAREILSSPYPFLCKKFRTDGRTIFAEAMSESGELDLLDLRQRQYVFAKVVEPSLYSGIEFGADEQAVRWYPMERSKAVVLDPELAFGKPIVTEVALRTDILYEAWLAEGKDKRRVAHLYEVPTKAIEAAIRFEQHQAA
jgi:uncharacterized protein (DUF433 family)/DNA-binding transcriptional MerR regulator